MIYQLTNALLIPKLEAMAKSVEGAEVDALRDMLVNAIGREDSRIFVSEKDGQVFGFMFSSIETFTAQEVVFIQFCVILPSGNEANLCNELLARTRAWGKEKGVKKMLFLTRRNPSAFARKYKFRFRSTLLERSI